MKRARTTRRSTARSAAAESGVALLISLFALLLICVVGVALLMATGTDSALTGNYRSANTVYYAALAGLEEGRSRLLTQWPGNTNMNLDTAMGLPPGTVPGTAQAWYIINPLPGEVVAPWDTGTSTTYPDLEWAQEFPAVPLPTANPALQQTASASVVNSPAGQLYTAYKWVRINAITAPSAKLVGVNVDNDTGLPTNSLTYSNNHLSVDQPGPQALEITALASLTMPNGTQSQRMLQYVVGPTTFNLTFPAALTLDGNNVAFTGPLGNQFLVNGNDTGGINGCVPGATAQAGIGYTNAADPSFGNITTFVGPDVSGIPPANVANYTGNGALLPNVNVVAVPPQWQTPSGLQSLALGILQNADVPVIPSTYNGAGAANQASLPAAMSALNPMTIVVNGDLDLTTWSGTGYGVLLVTGTLKLNSNAAWNGVVLVLGTGQVDATAGAGPIYGAVLVAQILDPATQAVLPNLGASSWNQSGGSGLGIYYSSCWINAVQKPITNKILSFREVPVN